jgi:hypothetical protein
MSGAAIRQHLVDCSFVLLVPDLFEPSVDKGSLLPWLLDLTERSLDSNPNIGGRLHNMNTRRR